MQIIRHGKDIYFTEKGNNVTDAVKQLLNDQAKKIKKLFTQHCDGCSMCPTCMSEFDERFLK